jgi:mRNA-degrading endonuclease RelE of RelBE toxin-antitoxin system
MSEQRYDLLQFAEWLKSDTTPNGGAALWEASALYDFQVDPNTNEISTQQFNQEYSNYLQEESFPALKERIENIVKVAPQLKDKSLLYKPVGFGEKAAWMVGEPAERFLSGESPSRLADIITNELSPLTKNTWEIDDFKELTDRLETFYNEGKQRLDNGQILEEGDAKLIQDVGSYLENLSENAEEIKSGDKKYVKLKDPIPFYYDEGMYTGMGERVGAGVKRQREPNWFDSFMEKSNSYFHKTANDLAEKYYEENKKNNIRYAAYENYLKDRPTEYFKDFRPTELWTDTILGLVPSITAIGAGTLTTIATGSPLVGYATTMGILNPLESTGEYQEAYDYVYNKSKDKELAKDIASKSTAGYLAVMNLTERLSIGRYMKNIMPKDAQRLTRRSLFKNMYKKIADDKRLYYGYEGLESGIREGSQEFIQYLSSVAIQSGYKDENFSDLYDAQTAKESFIGGALLGGGMGAAGILISGKERFSMEEMFANLKDKDAPRTKKGKPVYEGRPIAPVLAEQIEDKPTRKAEPTQKGLVQEIVTAGQSLQVSVDRDEVTDDKLKQTINELKGFGPGKKVEKLSYVLQKGGNDLLNSLDESDLENVNNTLKAGIKNISGQLADGLKDRENLAKDVVDGRIKIDYQIGKGGKISPIGKKPTISITDKQIIDDLVKTYEKDIIEDVGKKPSQPQISNWLNNNLNVNIGKQVQAQAEKQVGATPQAGQPTDAQLAAALGAFDAPSPPKKQPKPIPKKKKSTSAKAVEEQSIEQLKQTASPVDTFKTGTRYGVLQKNNPYSGKSGKLVKHDKKNNKVLLEFDDGKKFSFTTKQVAPIQEDAPIIKTKQKPIKKLSSLKQEVFKLSDKEQSKGFARVSDDAIINYIVKAPSDTIKKVLKRLPKKRREKLLDTITQYRNIIKAEGVNASEKQIQKAISEEGMVQLPSQKEAKKAFFEQFNKDIDKQVDKDFLEQEISRRVEEDVAGTMGYVPRDVLEKNIRKELEGKEKPKKIDKNKARAAADRTMAEIEQIEGVDIKKVGLPVEGGLERIGDIKVAEDKQGQGLASNWVNSLKIKRKTQGRDTIDIIAKPGSEGFWEKQGFISVKPYLSEKFEDQKNQPKMGEKGYLPSKFQAMKLPNFRDAVIDKDGNIKKVDGKEVTPMTFILNDYMGMDGVSLQDLIINAQLGLKDKPISEVGQSIKKAEEKPEKIKEVISNAADELKKGLEELGNITQKGAVSPMGDLSDKAAYNRAKQHFENSYDSLKSAYRITLEDYVHAMFKALKKLPKEIRQKIRDFLMKWAKSKDPDIHTRIAKYNSTIDIVDLMGFGNRRRMRISRELIDSGTMDKISDAVDNENDINSDDISREGLDIADVSDHEEISNNLTFDGYDFRGDQFFKFLETSDSKGWLDRKQVAKLMEAALTGDKEILLEHLESKYNYVPQTIQEQNLVQSFFIKNQPINRTNGYEKPAWWWTNIDYDGNIIKNKKNKNLIPKIGGSPRFGKDIRRNTDLPRTYNMSFVDWALQQNEYDGDEIKISRIYLKDLVNLWVGKKDKNGSKYFGKPEFSDLTLNKKSLVNVWDNIFANSSRKDDAGNPVIRTVAEIKGGGNNPSFIVARIPQSIIEMTQSTEQMQKYWQQEITRGNMTIDMAKEFIESVEELNTAGTNKYIFAQHITQHELMKRSHGAKYLMRTPDILHHMKRASLPYGEGIVPLGLGDNTIKIIDQTKVSIVNEEGTKVPMTDYIAGLEGLSRSDGATITDTDTLDTMAKIAGREQLNNGLPMREVKTIMWYSSLNNKFAKDNYPAVEYDGKPNWEGEHYVAIKHNEFVAEGGYKFVDEDNNIIAYTVEEGNKIRIYDNDGNRINRLLTLDEAKEPDGGSGSFKLDGRVATDVLTLPEESTRIVKVPGHKGKSSSAFPMTWLSKLYHPDFDKLRTQIENKLIETARANVRAMFDARKDPQIMASLFGQLKSNNVSFPNEIEKLIEPIQGEMLQDGYNLPHISSGVLEPIKNKLIRENAYKGRRTGFGNYATIKPDYDGTKVSEENGIAISEDDATMVNFVKQKLNLDPSLRGAELQNAFKEAILNMNNKGRGVYILLGRMPVYSVTGVTLGKITNIVPSGQGNVVFIHPELVSGALQADADGDAATMQIMYFGDRFQDESVINAMLDAKKAFDKRGGFARVEYFKKGKRDFPATSKKSIYQASSMIGNGLASQGILTNAINFFEDMHFKDVKMKIGKQTIVTRDPEEGKVIMDYAPLREDITQEMLDDAQMGTIVNKQGKPWKSGEKYLMTTPLNQLKILLQASVDHAKELLLYDWGYDGYDFIIPKMFVQDNGSPIGIKQSRTISRVLRKLLSYGNIRYGRDMDTRQTKGIASMFADSESMYELAQLNGKERGKVIADLANSRRNRFNKGTRKSKLAKSTLPIEEIIFNDKMTSIEKLIATPHEEMVRYRKENPNDIVVEHPWGYGTHQIVNGLSKTQADLYAIQVKEQRFYPETGWKARKKEARRWINQAGTEFYRIHARAIVYKNATEKSLNSASYPYADEMLDFINKWYNEGDKKKGIKAFKDLTKEQQAYTTLRFLRGIRVQEKQILKGVEKQSQAIVKNILATKEKIEQVESEKAKEFLTNKLNTLRNKLDKITTKTFVQKQPRVRDVEKILPMQLMDSDVWTTYANLAGPNIREASNQPMPLKMRKKYEDYLLKDCP